MKGTPAPRPPPPPPPPRGASREHGDAVGRGGRAVAPRVRVHARKALPDVGLRAALPHGAHAEALRRLVQLRAAAGQRGAPSPPWA